MDFINCWCELFTCWLVFMIGVFECCFVVLSAGLLFFGGVVCG